MFLTKNNFGDYFKNLILMNKNTLVFATGNAHKVYEVNEILKSSDFLAVPMSEYEVTEDIPETGKTMFENAWIKADYLKNKLDIDCFAEDSGLEIEALNMEPGIYTARYAGEQRNHIDNMNKVLAKLEGQENRNAQFRAVIALHINGKKKTFVGVVKGTIAMEKRGEGGFGYDPIFIPEGFDKTFAELPEDVKERISHRAKAVNEMAAFLIENDMDNIVEVEWLKNNMSDRNIIVLDASMPAVSGKISKYPNKVIPGALNMNLKDDFSDKTSSFPNTVPTEEGFAKACSDLGISQDSKIVLYDNLGVYSSPRAWFLFKLFGQEHVSVLNGGLPAWIEAGYEISDSYDDPKLKTNYNPTLNADLLTTKNVLFESINTKSFEIMDARSADRFYARVAEPRKNLRGGHMPEATSAPYSEFLDNGKFKSEVERLELFFDLIRTEKPIVFSCGSGITACIDFLAVVDLAKNDLSVYDGSWTEWATDEDMPVVVE